MIFKLFRAIFNLTSPARPCYVGNATQPAKNKRRIGPNQHERCFTEKSDEKRRDMFVFTLIRNPASAALSAYLELRFRARYGNKRYSGAEAFAALFMSTNENQKGDRSCASGTEARKDFLSFLAALENGDRTLGREAYHSWPQALKINQIQNRLQSWGTKIRRYDAIGRLESASEDLFSIRASILTSSTRGSNADKKEGSINASRPDSHLLTAISEESHHSHARSECSHVDLLDEEISRSLCRLYLVDYICFGLTLPGSCSKYAKAPGEQENITS